MLIYMPPNPSHLEMVDPVVNGMARAANTKADAPGKPVYFHNASLPITIHGDASFSGQGIVAETFNMSRVPGYDVTSWNGILIPAGTPRDIVARLNSELNKIIAAPSMRDRMIGLGYEPVGGPPERFGELIAAELAKWAPVVKATNVRVD